MYHAHENHFISLVYDLGEIVSCVHEEQDTVHNLRRRRNYSLEVQDLKQTLLYLVK